MLYMLLTIGLSKNISLAKWEAMRWLLTFICYMLDNFLRFCGRLNYHSSFHDDPSSQTLQLILGTRLVDHSENCLIHFHTPFASCSGCRKSTIFQRQKRKSNSLKLWIIINSNLSNFDMKQFENKTTKFLCYMQYSNFE